MCDGQAPAENFIGMGGICVAVGEAVREMRPSGQVRAFRRVRGGNEHVCGRQCLLFGAGVLQC